MKNKGLSSIMLLAMMAFGFIIFVYLMSSKTDKNSEISPTPTTASVSQSSDSAIIKQELDQTDVEFPSEELKDLENSLQSL